MRFTNSPYEDFMKEKSYFKGAPPMICTQFSGHRLKIE